MILWEGMNRLKAGGAELKRLVYLRRKSGERFR